MTGPDASAPSRPHAGYFALLAAAMIGAALYYPQFSLNHDSSWYLIATRKFLEGSQLYVDVMEINPPLAFYLTAPALIFASIAGLSDTIAFLIYVIILSGLSSAWVIRIVLGASLPALQRAMLILGSVAGLLILPINAFGQREHLMVILALPYFIHLILREDRTDCPLAEQIALGLVAALGIGLKPYFLLIPAFINLMGPPAGLIRRAFDPANVAMGVGLVCYAAFVLVVHPEYFSNVMPVATQVYSDFGMDTKAVLLKPETFALAFFLLLYVMRGTPTDMVTLGLIGAMAGALASYLVQFKGWTYQVIPFAFFLTISTLWLIAAKSVFARRDLLLGVLAVIALFFAFGFQLVRGPYTANTSNAFSHYVDRRGESILVLSTNVSASFPFVNEVGGRWASRFPAQWFIPGALQGQQRTDCLSAPDVCQAYDAILTQARDGIILDIARFQPDLVIIDARKEKSYFHGIPFDYLEFLSRDAGFPEIWAPYELVDTISEYQVWRRKSAPVSE